MGQRRVLVIGSQVERKGEEPFIPAAARTLFDVLIDPDRGAWTPAESHGGLLLDPATSDLRSAVRGTWRAASDAGDTLALAFVGHGEYDEHSESHYLLPFDAELDPLNPERAVDLMDLLGRLRGSYSGVDGCLVLLDTCYAGRALQEQDWLLKANFGWFRFEMLTASAKEVAADACFTLGIAESLRHGRAGIGARWRLEDLRAGVLGSCTHQSAQHLTRNADPGLYLGRNVQVDAFETAGESPSSDIVDRLTKWLVPTQGHDDVVAALERSRFVAIVGPAGSGKSTAIAALARPTRPPIAAATVFLSAHDDVTSIADALAGQIGALVPGFEAAQRQYEAETDAEVLDRQDSVRRRIVEPLSRIATTEVWLLLDALDQVAADTRTALLTAASAISCSPAPHRVVVSARPGLSLPEAAEAVPLPLASDRELSAYADRRRLMDDARASIRAHASGNWLLAQLLADVSGDAETPGLVRLRDVYGSLIQELQEGEADSRSWSDDLRAVLTLLAIAGAGPVLPLQLLTAASARLGASDRVARIRDQLVRLRHLVIRAQPGTTDEHAGLAHPSFAAYLRGQAPPELRLDLKAGHAAMAAAIEELAPPDAPEPSAAVRRYADRAEAEHRLAADDYSGAFESLVRRASEDERERFDRWTRFAASVERTAIRHDPLMLVDPGGPATYLQGRTQARREIVEWLRGSATGVLIVTGVAGSGKTALLRELLVNTWPELRRAMLENGQIKALRERDRPADRAFDASVRLTGASTVELVSQLGAALEWAAPADRALFRRRDALLAHAETVSPRTILVDALDEAQQPLFGARLLLDLAARRRVRIVVGTRPSACTGDGAHREILDLLETGNHTAVTLVREPDEIERHVVRELEGEVSTETLEAVSEAVKRGEREFLFGAIAVHETLAQRDVPQNVRDRLNTRGEEVLPQDGELTLALREALEDPEKSLFEVAVRRLTLMHRNGPQILEALGLARGRGIPIGDGVLAAAATALNDGTAVNEDHISEFLAGAGPYLRIDVDAGEAVLRLAHATFIEHFRKGDVKDREHRVAEGLVGLAGSRRGRLNPYLARHLPGHVDAAGPGGWLLLAGRPDVLDRLDFQAVRRDAFHTFTAGYTIPGDVGGVISSSDLFTSDALREGTGLRQLGRARALQERTFDMATPADPAWRLRSAVLRAQPIHMPLIAGAAVHLLAAGGARDRSPLLAAACADGMLRCWSSATGARVGVPIAIPEGTPTALCVFADATGQMHVIAGSEKGVVRVWAAESANDKGCFDVGGPLRAIAVIGGEEPLLVTGGDDHIARLWRLPSGAPAGELGDHGASIRCIGVHGGPDAWVATAGRNDIVCVWDPRAPGTPVNQLPHRQWVTSLCVYTRPDTSVVLATGSIDGTVRGWDPRGSDPLFERECGPAGVRSLTMFTDSAQRLRLATTDGTNRLAIWDAAAPALDGQILEGHTSAVGGVASWSTPGGRIRIATGGADRTVRVWDPGGARTPSIDEIGAIHTIAVWPDGAILTGGSDGVVRFWGTNGVENEARRIDTGHGAVSAMSVHHSANGFPLLVTGGMDERVRVWPDGNARRGRVVQRHAGRIRALAILGGSGPRLASAAEDGAIRVVRLDTGVETAVLGRNRRRPLRGLAATTTGVAAVGRDRDVELWDLAAPQAPAILEGHRNFVMAVCALPRRDTRSWLVTAADDMGVRIWDPIAKRCVAVLEGHDSPVRTVAASVDGSTIVSGDDGGTIRVWSATNATPLHAIRVGASVCALALHDRRVLAGLGDGYAVIDLDPT
jgi:WD40 repeat protein